MKKFILLIFLLSYNLWAMEQLPKKKQKIECSVKQFVRLPKEIILHIFTYAMPVLQNKEVCKNKNWEKNIVLNMPVEFFSQDLLTYKNVSGSCKQFKHLLKDDEGIVGLMRYFKQQKELKLKMQKAEKFLDGQSISADDWDAFDW